MIIELNFIESSLKNLLNFLNFLEISTQLLNTLTLVVIVVEADFAALWNQATDTSTRREQLPSLTNWTHVNPIACWLTAASCVAELTCPSAAQSRWFKSTFAIAGQRILDEIFSTFDKWAFIAGAGFGVEA